MSGFHNSGWPVRRKRNLNLGDFNRPAASNEKTTGINWSTRDKNQEQEELEMEEIECEEDEVTPENAEVPTGSRQQEQAISNDQITKNFQLNGRDLQIGPLQKTTNFHEDYQKLTIYVEKDLQKIMKGLKEAKYIPSFSWVVNQALKHYFTQKG